MTSGSPAASAVDRLLRLETISDGSFSSTIAPRGGLTRLFGGQVAAQALLAASRTVSRTQIPHSLHAYFVRAGRPDVPVRYDVALVRDGRSFSTRRVTVEQEGKSILELMASFHELEDGADWQMRANEMPAVPSSSAADDPRLANMRTHLEIRSAGSVVVDGWRFGPFWFRTSPPIGDDEVRNAAMLTYVSDIALLANARDPEHRGAMSHVASLDHAIWFHRRPRLDDWLLFSTEPVAHVGARGTARGTFHTESGQLVASVVQEGLMRPARRRRW